MKLTLLFAIKSSVYAPQETFRIYQEIRPENSVSIQFASPQLRGIKPARIDLLHSPKMQQGLVNLMNIKNASLIVLLTGDKGTNRNLAHHCDLTCPITLCIAAMIR